MASAVATLPAGRLKRTAQHLHLDVESGTEKAQLAEAVVKRAKTDRRNHFFSRDAFDLSIIVHTDHEPLSRDERIAGCILASAANRHSQFAMYSVQALAHTSMHPSVIQWRKDAIEALDSEDEAIARAAVVDANKMLAERLGKKVVSAWPHLLSYESNSNYDGDDIEDLSHDWTKRENPVWREPFFQGAKLVFKALQAADDDEGTAVPLDQDGICTLETFVEAVCNLKVGKPYDDKAGFNLAYTRGCYPCADDEDADDEDAAAAGACLTYEWED